ncbi:hypothetical protein [Sanguibacter sp. 25GB23B1]|uniref:hypothetical protein n=2 Tax=unclassified Sanguibacter TaxID=2645534 RepID=UPI0032AF1FEA
MSDTHRTMSAEDHSSADGAAPDVGGTSGTADRTTKTGAVSRARAAQTWLFGLHPVIQWTLVSLGFVLLAGVLAAKYIPAHPAMSRADEWVYIDAVDKASHGEITRMGALIDEYSLELISCRGIELFGPMGSPCEGPIVQSEYPYEGGRTSADIHSPVYFFITAWTAKLIMPVLDISDLLTGARLTGAIWLGLGLAATVALARNLGASRTASAAVAFMLLGSTMVRWTNTYVTPDAFNILAGALLALAAVKYVRSEWRAWPLLVLSGIAVAIKAQNLFAVGLAALVLLVIAVVRWRDESVDSKRMIGVGLGAGVIAVVVQAGYLKLREVWAIGEVPIIDAVLTVDPWTAYSQTTVFMEGIILGPDQGWLPGLNAAATTGALPSIMPIHVSWLLIGGLIAASLFVRNLTLIQSVFARSTLFALLFGAPLLYVVLFFVNGQTFALPQRYGVVLLPAFAVVTAIVADRRWVAWGLLAIGVATYGEAVVHYSLR